MHIDKDRFGDDIVMYDSREEELAAIRNYLRGHFAALTCKEIEMFRDCEEDPNGVRWEAEHAGRFSEEVDELDFNGLVFVHDVGRTFEEGRQILLDRIGPHPITPLTLWELSRELWGEGSRKIRKDCDRPENPSLRANTRGGFCGSIAAFGTTASETTVSGTVVSGAMEHVSLRISRELNQKGTES